MISLVMTFCLTVNAASCIERQPVMDEALSPMGCMIAAQQLGAKFVRDHPAYQLVSWRCGISKPSERSI